jgi:hypothetical protein
MWQAFSWRWGLWIGAAMSIACVGPGTSPPEVTVPDATAPSLHDTGVRRGPDGQVLFPDSGTGRDGGTSSRSGLPSDFYLSLNGAYFYYPRESSTRFGTIRENIESGYYDARGVQFLTFYCPYRAAEEWRGVPAIDFFDTNPNTGTIEDFRAMAAAADAHGIAVTMYIGLLFVDWENARWIQAQRDHAARVDSDAENTFLWEGDPGYGNPARSAAGYAHSAVAGANFATSWDHPAINLGHPAGRAYVASVLQFWIDAGVDGFEYDAPGMFWGWEVSRVHDLLTANPDAYAGRRLYYVPEGTTYRNEEEHDAVGYTHQLLGDDDDERSLATDVLNGERSFDELEAHFRTYLDARRERGRGSKSVSTEADLTVEQRAFEAALLAGNGAHFEIAIQGPYGQLNSAQRATYDAVFAGLARSPAEAPIADRVRLHTNNDNDFYAVLRVSADGTERAVNVYNRTTRSAHITVNLRSAGIADGSTTTELITNAPAGAARGGSFEVDLPGPGYGFYRFE